MSGGRGRRPAAGHGLQAAAEEAPLSPCAGHPFVALPASGSLARRRRAIVKHDGRLTAASSNQPPDPRLQ